MKAGHCTPLRMNETPAMRRVLAVVTGLIAGLLATWNAPAAAQSLAGLWNAGATTSTVRIESWGPDCGPEPRSSRTPGGGQVQVSEAGNVLIIHSSDRDIRTDRCWSENPAMRRRSSSAQTGSWKLKCQTPESDPREETGAYSINSQGDTELRYRDESRYNWQLRNSRCVATIVTTQVLQRSIAQASGTNPTSGSQVDKSCNAGAATRLLLRPQQAQIAPGQELCLKATAVDAQGCALKNPSIRFALEHARGSQGELKRQCFVAGKETKHAEGAFTIVATLGQLRAQSTVTVARLDLSALIAKRLDVGAVTAQPSATSTTQPTEDTRQDGSPSESTSTGIRGPSDSQGQEGPAQAIRLLSVALATIVLLGVAFLLYKRRRPALGRLRSQPSTNAEQSSDTQHQQQALERRDTNMTYRSVTSADPSPSESSASAVENSEMTETWICPSCRRGFPAARQVCPKCEGPVRLIPYAEFARTPGENSSSKRCADCGAECTGRAQFCGECGGNRLLARVD